MEIPRDGRSGKISTGPNAEPLNDTVADTGPGIPDDALAPGEDGLPEARPTKRWRRQPKRSMRRLPRVTRFRWTVNDSRPSERRIL
jgi:hypothetical protein